jgi:hypothetical protein
VRSRKHPSDEHDQSDADFVDDEFSSARDKALPDHNDEDRSTFIIASLKHERTTGEKPVKYAPKGRTR